MDICEHIAFLWSRGVKPPLKKISVSPIPSLEPYMLDSIDIRDVQLIFNQVSHKERPTGRPDSFRDCPNCH
jgi:hypothetical protein